MQAAIEGKPRLMSLARQGDPQGALALTFVSGDASDDPPYWAALLSSRLRPANGRFEVLARPTGVAVVVPLEDADSVARGMLRIDEAIRKPVSKAELENPNFRQELKRLGQSYLNDVARCGAPSENKSLRDRLVSEIESMRRSVVSPTTASWSVVGGAPQLEAAERTLRSLDAWPRQDRVSRDPPSVERAVFSAGQSAETRIRINWQLPLYATALAAERELNSTHAALSLSLAALPTAMQVECVRALPLISGGKLELSIAPYPNTSLPSIEDLIAAAQIAAHELRVMNKAELGDYADLAILELSRATAAAERAAWASASNEVARSAETLAIRVELGPELAKVAPSAEQDRALARALVVAPESQTLPLVRMTEAGQGSVYALVASSCAGWSETSRSVGATALAIRALAVNDQNTTRVSVEPWITPEGIGLLGRVDRQAPSETAAQMAERLGDALGRALATWPLDSSSVWRARHQTLLRLGSSPRPALWQALGSIAGQTPALVLPDGTFGSVEGVSTSELLDRRRALLRTPLKLAVLENSVSESQAASQAETVRNVLWRWLAPHGVGTEGCPRLGAADSSAGEARVEPRRLDPEDAAITAAVPLPNSESQDESNALVLLHLLDGSNGWLSARLRDAAVPSTVEARIVGGTRRRGVVIAIGTTDSGVETAVQVLRRSLQEMGGHAELSPTLIGEAIRAVEQANLNRRSDPRARLEDVWVGREPRVAVDLKSFRNYLKRAFSNSNLMIVRSEPNAVRSKR
jgi:hypothetical protein